MIVGRQAEQAILHDLVAGLRKGSGHLIVLASEAGLGKTTLLDWTESQSEDIPVLRARGRPSEADLPFVALSDLLRPFTDDIDDLARPQARALSAALALIEGSPVDRGAVNFAALALLTNLQRPLLLLIDDYHWLDTASREVIDFVARRARGSGLGVVVATRDSWPDPRTTVIQLDPISTEAASELLRNLDPLPPEAEGRILAFAPATLSPCSSCHSILRLWSLSHSPDARSPFLSHSMRLSATDSIDSRARPGTPCCVRHSKARNRPRSC